ncbi:MAG: hypothetical protein ACOVVK_13185 [Elsteraceae bacterium]
MNIPPVTPIIIPLATAVQPRVLAPTPPAAAVTEHPPMPVPHKEPVQLRDKRDRDQEQPRRRRRRALGNRADLKA